MGTRSQAGENKAMTSSSSVEAARKFLEQVGVTDEGPKKVAAVRPSALPDRFPGEEGGFLRQISTRSFKKADQTTSMPPAASPVPLSSSTTSSVPAASTSKDSTKPPFQAVKRQVQGEPLHTISSTPRNSGRGKERMNAYEFFRSFRQCSAASDEASKHASQLSLLTVSVLCSLPVSKVASDSSYVFPHHLAVIGD